MRHSYRTKRRIAALSAIFVFTALFLTLVVGETTLASSGGLRPNTAYSYRVTFRDAAGAAIESVTGTFTTTNCLNVSCSASPTSVEIGQNVTWTASASGGADPYSFSWSGDVPLEGQTGNPASVSYSTSGTKTGSVRATSGGLSATQVCSNSVSVGAANRPPDNPGGGGGGGGGGGCSGNTDGNPDACGGGVIIPPGNPANSNPGTASFGESTAGVCTAPLQPTLFWTYSDPDGDSQSAYQIQVDQIQVDTNSLFESPLTLDTGKTLSGVNSYIYPTSCSFCAVFNPLIYNNTYYWRVRVWDSKDAVSNWANGDTFATQPHAAPSASYSWDPLSPNANQPTDFTPQTQGASYTYNWAFPDGNPSSSVDQKPRKVKFSSTGAKSTSLIIKDSDNLSCGAQRTVNVGGTPTTPGWIEIPPE